MCLILGNSGFYYLGVVYKVSLRNFLFIVFFIDRGSGLLILDRILGLNCNNLLVILFCIFWGKIIMWGIKCVIFVVVFYLKEFI